MESPTATVADRSKLAEMLFETFRVTAVCFANSAPLSLMASGRVTGLSVEVGAGVTHISPVFQGLVLAHAQKRLDFGGQDITRETWKTLGLNGVQIEVWTCVCVCNI